MDEKAKRQKRGKRAVIGDNIAICKADIRDGFLAAEELSHDKKKRKRDKKCKSKAKISEEVFGDEELAGDSSESDESDSFGVGSA